MGIDKMLQISKLINSRNKWKKKAVKRANEVRELKKTKYRYQNRIAELKTHIEKLEQVNKKN